jgi:hypothetical protein
MFACHVYNAGVQNQLLGPGYADLKYMVKTQAESHIYFGARPGSFEDCHKRLRLVKGTKLSEVARQQRAKQQQGGTGGKNNFSVRRINLFSPYVQQIHRLEGVRTMTRKSIGPPEADNNFPLYTLEKVVRHHLETKANTVAAHKPKRSHAEQQELTPLQTLATYL